MPTPTDTIRVPLPDGVLTAQPTALRWLAQHIRQELRRLVPLSAESATYQIRLPGGRTLAGTPVVLLRLADRIEHAAGIAGPTAQRARVAQRAEMRTYTPPAATTTRLDPARSDTGTQRLPELTANLTADYDPTDPAAGPGPQLYPYLGCVWSPDATATDGWQATTAEVEIHARAISFAAVRLAATEAVELAADELLAVRWADAPAPTCFLTAAQVGLAQRLLRDPTHDSAL